MCHFSFSFGTVCLLLLLRVLASPLPSPPPLLFSVVVVVVAASVSVVTKRRLQKARSGGKAKEEEKLLCCAVGGLRVRGVPRKKKKSAEVVLPLYQNIHLCSAGTVHTHTHTVTTAGLSHMESFHHEDARGFQCFLWSVLHLPREEALHRLNAMKDIAENLMLLIARVERCSVAEVKGRLAST